MDALRLLGLGFAAAVAVASFPPVATAQRVVPPGNSGASQYTETLPGPGGDVPTGEAKGGASPAKALGASNAARLEALGTAGRAAARLAAETAPGRADGHRGAGPGGAENPSGTPALSQILGQVTGSSDSGGMGLLLPLLIALAAVAAAALVLIRRRMARSRD